MAIHKLYQREPSFGLTIKNALELRDCYGGEVTLDQVVAHIQGNKTHKCPKCNGLGYTVKEYNKYPTGLPDSGWVYEPGYKILLAIYVTEKDIRSRNSNREWFKTDWKLLSRKESK